MVIESRRERYSESQDGDGRRGSLDYEELDGLLAAADRSLNKKNLRSANESLKRASVKAATMWGGTGVPALPGHVGSLIGLLSEVQRDIGDPQRKRYKALRTELGELRARFEAEAREDA